MDAENNKRISKDRIAKKLANSNKQYWNLERLKLQCRLASLVDDEVLAKVLKEDKARKHFRRRYGAGSNLLAVMGDPVYYYFAQYISTDCIVIDFYCGNNSQAYFFDQHRLYIGVEPRERLQFQPPNSRLYKGNAQAFLGDHKEYLNREDVYVIVNWSLDLKMHKQIKELFPNRIIYTGFSLEIT